MRRKTKGIVLGMTGACSYGTNPLFALPLYALGLCANSVLFYRYSLAVLLYGLWVAVVKHHSLKISWKQAAYLLPMGLIFSISSLTLFMSYSYIDAGIASTILFIYPILVAVIMAVCFGERLSRRTLFSIFLTTVGIAMFYKGKSGETINLFGVALVLISALSYAVYMVAIKKLSAIRRINYAVLTFYVMLFGLLVYLFNLRFGLDLQIIPAPLGWICAVALALLPTIVSLETMTIAIKLIGPTLSAVLGALEPVTAIFFGVVIFHEQLTLRIAFGILLILTAVLMIVLEKKKSKNKI